MFTRKTLTAVALLAVGCAFLLPHGADAASLPQARISIGSTGSASVVGTIESISGTTLTVRSWGATFRGVVTDTTKLYPSVRTSTPTNSQRLSAYNVGDVVTLYGKMSPETYTVTAVSVTNHTEQNNGSEIYQVKRAIQGTLTEVVPNSRVVVRERTTNTLYTLTINSASAIYNKSGSMAGTALAGWESGNEVYAYALLSGTQGVATYLRNYTYSPPVAVSAPTATFYASPTLITSGQTSRLSWSTSRATSCTLSPSSGSISTSGSVTVSPTSNTTYTLVCTGAGGSVTKTATVSIRSATSPTVVNGACGSANGSTFTSRPTSNLCSAGTASSVSGTGPWTWQCNGSNGGSNASCTARLQSASAPTATFSASPTSITAGQTSRLTWSSSGATSCIMSPSSGSSNTSGSITVSPTVTTTYRLACTGTGGSVTRSVIVTVTTAPTPTIVNGVCGSANGSTVASRPTTNLCSAGTATTVSGTGPWTWQCRGTNGGTTASCSAQISSVVPPPPPPPPMP